MDTGWRGPSASNSNSVCNANCDGIASNSYYNRAYFAVRPVVSIPKSEVVKTALGI